MRYQGLNIIGRELVAMASEASPEHEQHIYNIFSAVEKLLRVGTQQLIGDYIDSITNEITVDFQTYLNGEKINQDEITRGVAKAIQRAIDSAGERIKISV